MNQTTRIESQSPHGLRIPRWLADDCLQAYTFWREECTATRRAYALWHSAPRSDRSLAFAGYRASLDREERAAQVLREHVERIRYALK